MLDGGTRGRGQKVGELTALEDPDLALNTHMVV